ncbi:hypothetical protein [Paenibacillus sp. An7]|nr:hypothetical protein [Paenibacillus sp. An7]
MPHRLDRKQGMQIKSNTMGEEELCASKTHMSSVKQGVITIE